MSRWEYKLDSGRTRNGKKILKAWTGTFRTEKECDEWFKKYGVNHESRGRKLIKIKINERAKK